MSELIDAETALLGVLLSTPEALPSAAAQLKPEDFSAPHHGRFYSVLLRAHAEGLGSDPATLTSLFPQQDRAKVRKWIGTALSGYPRSSNVDSWVQIIRTASIRRQAIALLEKYSGILPESEDLGAALQSLASATMALGRSRGRVEVSRNDALAKEALGLVEARIKSPSGLVGLSTGLRGLDSYFQGMRGGQLIGIGARPGDGKTSLSQQIGMHVARNGARALFCSLEMSALEIMERELSMEAEVNVSAIHLAGHKQAEQLEALAKAANLAMSDRFLKVAGSLSVHDIKAIALQEMAKGGLAILIVDYLQIIKRPQKAPVTEELGVISGELKSIAMELEIPVVVATQLNRNSATRDKNQPSKDDISYCDRFFHDCHKLALLHRWEENGEKRAAIRVEKNRSGYCGVVACDFLPQFTKYVDV